MSVFYRASLSPILSPIPIQQLALDKIVLLKGEGAYKNGYRNKINQKSVDFVLFDKQNIAPVLVIELDDSSHERQSRQERDAFVDRVKNQCGVPILHARSIRGIDEWRNLIGTKVQIR